MDTIGAKTKKLFPTGNLIDEVNGIKCTLADAAMPVVFCRAKDFGLSGNEDYLELNKNQKLIDDLKKTEELNLEMLK